jgi:signal transduction histidine kinase
LVPSPSASGSPAVVGAEAVPDPTCGVHPEDDAVIARTADVPSRSARYGHLVHWIERQLERLRSLPRWVVDGLLALVLVGLGMISVFSQDLTDGMREPPGFAHLTIVLVCAPVAIRRWRPLLALVVGCAAIFVHVGSDWPEGMLPMVVMLLAYSVGAWEAPRPSVAGLAVIYLTLLVLGMIDTAGLDALGVAGNMAFFTVAWTIGVAMRARRETTEARVRAAEEQANLERQSAARAVAEERLRIAQELHDVVAHSMSVIAVQAGVGAHVLDDRPEQARAALEAISATSRGTLAEMRRLLGVLRDGEGERDTAPAPGLGDLPSLVDDVRAAGVPVTLTVTGAPNGSHAAVELSAYRVVQEALTNVIKHAGAPTRVAVDVRHEPGSLVIDVVDDGRGAAGVNGMEGSGHGLLGMRERVEVWGGELVAGPARGGGYRVHVVLPYGEAGT